ncbi:MFS transporter [Pantoea vagans]|uniref:MFS transporter n=1 Tax=Pantoea vagans TaxID=470934 RepID=UPI003019AE43
MLNEVLSYTSNTIKTRFSTRVIFFICGFATGAWAPLVPYAQQRLALDPSLFGSLLLCMGAGSLCSMSFSGYLAGKFGCQKMICMGVFVFCCALPILAIANTIQGMMLTMFFFGAGMGLTDVTMNIQGALIEQNSTKPLMSGFHGMYSVGGITGAAGGSFILTQGFSIFQMALTFTIMIVLLMLMSAKNFLTHAFDSQGEKPKAPIRLNLRIIIMALMSIICFLAEGSIMDWGGIWLTTLRNLNMEFAGWGYAIFGIAMSLMRLCGDRFIHLLGKTRVLMLSSACSVIGFTIPVVTSEWEMSLLGFFLVGVGAANVVPIITSLAANEKIMPPNLTVSIVSTFAYLGTLMGPALLGFIAHQSSLSTSFSVIACLMVLLILGTIKLNFKN